MRDEFETWREANQHYLAASLAVVGEALQRHAEGKSPSIARKALEKAAEAMPSPAAVEVLCESFGLSPFERDVVLLCAGMDLESGFAARCAAARGDPSQGSPTFGLALSALPEPHWDALNPSAPLRYWRLIEVGDGPSLTHSPLRIDERILHYLTGVQHIDERFGGMIKPLFATVELAPSHHALAQRIAGVFSAPTVAANPPAVQLCGEEASGKRAIAAMACARLGVGASVLSAAMVPADSAEIENLIRLWLREAALTGNALYLDCEGLDPDDKARDAVAARLIEEIHGVLIVGGRERRQSRRRSVVAIDVPKPTVDERRVLWLDTLAPVASRLNGRFEKLISQFNFAPAAIRTIGAEVACRAQASDPDAPDGAKSGEGREDLTALLWDACRAEARPRLDGMAQRIEPAAGWDDLVLPEPQRRTLKEIVVHVDRRLKVYEDWGFAGKCKRGLGISVLFSGTSGTGKTMAAEVLAEELKLDLYKIDLSAVVSKYIGETERNLRQVFDAAEEGGAILLFDEADALFGKRSEVKDSHDRYANIEVSYLLQRMESYRGLAILTTNMKEAMDQAFLRRIRFTVPFPFPDAASRAEIWRNIFPKETPLKGLDHELLARLSIAGGNIRNIALNAAFLAAGKEDGAVGMDHLLRAARGEFPKPDKPLNEAEVRGWVE